MEITSTMGGRRRIRGPIGGAAAVAAILTLSVPMGPGRAAAAVDGDSFDDWTVRCKPRLTGTGDLCYIFQDVHAEGGGKVLLKIAVGPFAPDGLPAVLVKLPLGISLPPGVALRIGQGEDIRFPVERCDKSGCEGGVAMDAKLLTLFRREAEARVTFHDGVGQAVTAPVSLRGFSKGFESLR